MTGGMERQIGSRLREMGVRNTPARKEVVARLAGEDGPRSAAELHELLGGSIPLSSLYRTLAVLEEAGVLAPHHGTRGLTRYELAEWLKGHHHHLVCVECGAVDDIHLAAGMEETLESVVASVTAEATFEAAGHSLEIEGRCGRCA